ncbi:NADH pyrophosphatase [Lachnospiraceae bacterium]|jgi:ADP-ribose pyrophosphatase|nr:NADH pyrophosphatase [Lachnospiraceae bacterium]
MNCSIKARRRMSMKLIKMEKVKDGKYLKNYELTYRNKAGKEKTYEIVSRKELSGIEDIGQKVSGLSIAAVNGDKLLLLREFRMGVNKIVYNLCAGMLEEGESLEQCIRRELYEETGLQVKRIIDILPASYAAVAISDTKTSIVFVEAEGEFEDHTSDNEWIEAGFYTKEEVRELLKTAEFSSRAQIIAYFFARGVL